MNLVKRARDITEQLAGFKIRPDLSYNPRGTVRKSRRPLNAHARHNL